MKKAIIIESKRQLNNYKAFCKTKNICVCVPTSCAESFPSYQQLIKVGDIIYSLHNGKIEGENSVLEMGYIPFTFKQFMDDPISVILEACSPEQNEKNKDSAKGE